MSRRLHYTRLSVARRHPRLFQKLVAAAALVAAALPAHALDTKTRDEHAAMHFAGSALIAGVATHYTGSELEGFGIAFTVGVAKEVYDTTRPAVQSTGRPKDAFTCKALLWDSLGAALGAKLGGLTIEKTAGGVAVGYSGSF